MIQPNPAFAPDPPGVRPPRRPRPHRDDAMIPSDARHGRRRAFTLLELIIVLTILGFLAAVLIPYAGRMDAAERIKLTQDRLEQIRTAIVGPRFVCDAQGRPVVGGYVGDVGALPPLCAGELRRGTATANIASGSLSDRTDMRWVYANLTGIDGSLTDATQVLMPDGRRPFNHPAALFTEPNPTGVGAIARWRGPYLSPGKDPYRNDHAPYAEVKPADLTPDDRSEYAMRCTTDRLNDAWGRSLLFWRDGDDLWIISEGANGRSAWEAGAYRWDPDAADASLRRDADDIVLRIAADEWRDVVQQQVGAARTYANAFGATGGGDGNPVLFGPAADAYDRFIAYAGYLARHGIRTRHGTAYRVMQYPNDGTTIGDAVELASSYAALVAPAALADTSPAYRVLLIDPGPDGTVGKVSTLDGGTARWYHVPGDLAGTDAATRSAAMAAIVNAHRTELGLTPLPAHVFLATIDAECAKSADDRHLDIDILVPVP